MPSERLELGSPQIGTILKFRPGAFPLHMAQTPDGYVWFGTEEGLARFDGGRFTVFDKRTTPALRNDFIFSLLVDRNGGLGIGTRGGLAHYSRSRLESFSSRIYTDVFCW
jgi:ligand-binding sensor domain-containing protein